MITPPKDAESAAAAANAAFGAALPFDDTGDFAGARCRLIAELPEGVAHDAAEAL